MAFVVMFPTSNPVGGPDQVQEWLTARGEPCVREGGCTVALRALPLRFDCDEAQGTLACTLRVTSTVPLSRVVDVLFDVSVQAGADVHLEGVGALNRSDLWMRLADEQDRLRIAESLRRARELNYREEIHRRLWAVLSTLRPGHDDRWDAQQRCVVELLEVGESISLEQARPHAQAPARGDVVPVPVVGHLHCLVWRWLSEAYPGIAEPEHTLH